MWFVVEGERVANNTLCICLLIAAVLMLLFEARALNGSGPVGFLVTLKALFTFERSDNRYNRHARQ